MLGVSLAGQEYPWGSAQVIGPLAFGVAMLILFLFIETRAPEPLLPLSRMFRNRIFAVVSFSTFFSGMAMFGIIMFIPLFGQGVLGDSATNSGLVLTPMMLGAVVSSTVAGQLLSRWSRYRYLALAGMGDHVRRCGPPVHHEHRHLQRRDGPEHGNRGDGPGDNFPAVHHRRAERLSIRTDGPGDGLSCSSSGALEGHLGVAVLGSLLASRLSIHLANNLSPETRQVMGTELSREVQDPNALINPEALALLEDRLQETGDGVVLESVVEAMRESLSASIQEVFVVASAFAIVGAVVLVGLKEIPLRKASPGVEEGRSGVGGRVVGGRATMARPSNTRT